MQIQKFEQSGFILTSTSGFRLAIDIAGLTPLETIADTHVDAMLVSHIHGDHFSSSHIDALRPNTLYMGDESIEKYTQESNTSAVVRISDKESITIGDFALDIFEVDHGPNTPQSPKQNFGFLIKEGKESLYFSGDMYYPSGIEVSAISPDYVCIAVGGHYTFDAQSAFEFLQTFHSITTVIPMHYEAAPHINTASAVKLKKLAKDIFNIQLY